MGMKVTRATAKLRHLCILNRLFPDPKEFPENFDVFFDTLEARNFDSAAAQMTMIADALKEVKRQTVAFKHFVGETDYSFEDYIREVTKTREI